MTSGEVTIIRRGGITCKSDAGLYIKWGYSSWIKVLSLYGSPQQVRAIFALLIEGQYVEVGEDRWDQISVYSKDHLRLKSFPLGYGKRHALIFTEDIHTNSVIWVTPEEKERAMVSALSKRRIPFDGRWLPMIEEILREENIFIPLQGWGGLGGYYCFWDDDKICDLIAERILKGKDRRKEWSSEDSLKSTVPSLLPG